VLEPLRTAVAQRASHVGVRVVVGTARWTFAAARPRSRNPLARVGSALVAVPLAVLVLALAATLFVLLLLAAALAFLVALAAGIGRRRRQSP
jgi:putative flippase GtrA